MALALFMRTIVAETAVSSFGALSMSFIIVVSVILSVIKYVQGEKFRMAWHTKSIEEEFVAAEVEMANFIDNSPIDRSQKRFSKMSFLMVIGGGLCDFMINLSVIISFKVALYYGINAGIATVTAPLSSVFVAIIAYFRYGEKLYFMHLFGFLIVSTGTIIIAMFPAEETSGEKNAATSGQIFIVLGLGLITTVSFAVQLLLSKALVERGADGRFIGLNYSITSGIFGTIVLIILTCSGSGLFALGLKGTLLMMLAGITSLVSIA